MKIKTYIWITLLIVELIHEVKARWKSVSTGISITEMKKSDFRPPSTMFGEMKSRPGRARIEGY